MKFKDYVKEGFVLLDGGTGSNLQLHGMQAGDCPETWILDHPDVFVELQKGYIEAGSDVLYAPTFTCSSIKLAEYGLEGRQKELITDLVQLTKRAVEESRTERNIYIAGDMTMTGEQLEPVGSLPFEELIDVYKEQAAYLYNAGVDLFVVETMMSLQECRGAVLAIREQCGDDIPVIVTLTFQEDGRMLYGTNPETAAIVLEAMGVDVIGVNCSAGLLDAASISITFMLAFAAMARQIRHSPQGPSSVGFSQLTVLAKIFATVVLPVPLVPVNRYACPIRLARS